MRQEEIYGFITYYFPEPDDSPFADGQEQWRIWERFVDMLCMISLVMKEKEQPESLERIGCLLRDTELMKALEPRERAQFPCRGQVRAIFGQLVERGRITEEQEEILPLWQFFNAGTLEPVEMAALLFAACADRNRKYERAFGVLMEETEGAVKPTVGLVHDLCSLFLTEEENQTAILLDPDSFLNRFLLEPVKEGGNWLGRSRMSRPVSLRRQALAFLSGSPGELGALSCCAKVLENTEPEAFLSHEEEFGRLLNLFTGILALEETALIRLEGMKGVGKKFLMQSLGTVAGMEVLCIRMPQLMAQSREKMEECLTEAALRTVYSNGILYLEEAEFGPESRNTLQWVLTFLQDYVKVLFLGTEKHWPDNLAVTGNSYAVSLKLPDSKEQKTFWQHFAEEFMIRFTEDVDLDQVVSRYYMTPEKIRQTLQSVSLTADADEGGFLVSGKMLEEEVRRQCGTALSEYATRIESPFVWEDLQLAEQSGKLLWDACNRVRYRSVVNDQYGFGKKLPYGGGISIVLYGPPGTGKTMAAQVLAKELGMDIYRIDLSQIGSKYIGETEKNLGKVFDAARFSNAVLFFDEADALFTKRTDVSSSNDKYANAETAYLLQKIEEYSGVSILATNIMQNFDNAFKRRMTFMIPVEQPDEEARLKLWQKVFPVGAPLEKDVDFEVYARIAQLTGSNIKSAALAAAYQAAAGHRAITNQDIIEAVEFEYRRTGRTGIANELYGALYMRT